MARLLCVWEQGGQLGHLNRLRLPIELALQMGHEVFLAARELHNVKLVMGELPITVLQAPFKQITHTASAQDVLSYTHLIGRECFSSANELDALLDAWVQVFDAVHPQAVLFEHSPTALLAARPYPFRKILIGAGFELASFCPFPTAADTPDVAASLRRDEAALLACMNQALARRKAAALPDLPALYAADDALCMSWPALDPFGPRANLHYLGVPPRFGGEAPQWPAGTGAKVFGYLQSFAGLPLLLDGLNAAGLRALLVVRDMPARQARALSTASVQITSALLDLGQVAATADWAINHANHGTAAALAGLPQLLIPRYQEQLLLALRLVRRGCAALAFQDQGGFSKAIEAMQTQTALAMNARILQTELAQIDPQHSAAVIRDVLARALRHLA